MVKGYEVYCLVDPLFYESPTLQASLDSRFSAAQRPLPAGWTRTELDDWLVYMPDGLELPRQGWKIHASACLDNAEDVVQTTWDYCTAHGIGFKFVAGRELFFTRNLKYAHRGSSGKLVTIYPRDDDELERILSDLGERLGGQAGPYILSDLRWGGGPLFVRYGGFAELYCIGPSGVQELAIEDADGRLVPDRRGPTFQVPEWIALPEFLKPHLDARNSVKVDELPCSVEHALHFSNSGGVYLGTDRQAGDKVVLKEARPFAGLATDGTDGVTRLQRERDNLAQLAGIPGVPGLRDYRVVGEHHFLMQDYIEGKSLHSCLAERNPLVLQVLEPEAAERYADWVMGICRRVEDAVRQVHERGLAILDLHPSNVLVREDDEIALIDLEMASDGAAGSRQTLADPAFLAPAGTTGFAVDRHALGCLRLYVFMPITAVFGLDPGKPAQLAIEIAKLFPTARQFVEEAAEMISGARPSTRAGGPAGDGPEVAPVAPLEPTRDAWLRCRDSLRDAILASATPDRDDRLFPGDVEQFASGGLNLAHGAAGVLYALHATGAGRFPEHEAWLVSHALNPPGGTRLGLYDGLHGVAFALDALGRTDEALAVLDRCREEMRSKHRYFGLDLRGGLAGIGLNLLHFARRTGDGALADEAQSVVELVADRLGTEDSVPTVSGGDHPYAGLIRGSSGAALLFLRRYDETGDPALLELAHTAIRQDLRRCITRPEDGALEVNEGWRSCPYLADGGVGIAFALQDYLARAPDAAFREALDATRLAAEAQFYIESGLFYGRAGMILFLSREHGVGTLAGADPVVAAQVRRLAWHAVPYRGHLAFPGDRLVRLSMDLATGSAGVLLAMGAALHDAPVHLPFLEAPGAGAHHAADRGRADGDLALDLVQAASRELVSTAITEGR